MGRSVTGLGFIGSSMGASSPLASLLARQLLFGRGMKFRMSQSEGRWWLIREKSVLVATLRFPSIQVFPGASLRTLDIGGSALAGPNQSVKTTHSD